MFVIVLPSLTISFNNLTEGGEGALNLAIQIPLGPAYPPTYLTFLPTSPTYRVPEIARAAYHSAWIAGVPAWRGLLALYRPAASFTSPPTTRHRPTVPRFTYLSLPSPSPGYTKKLRVVRPYPWPLFHIPPTFDLHHQLLRHTMVGVPGKYRGCETCRSRRVKCGRWRHPIFGAFRLYLWAPGKLNGRYFLPVV